MIFDSKTGIWSVLPFGFDPDPPAQNGGDGANGNDGANNQEQQQNSGQQQSGAQSGASNNDDDDDDDDDELEGLSAKELRRIARDNAKKAKTAERERDSAKNQLTEEERKKLTEDQQKDLRITELSDENASLRASLNQQALLNAIQSDRRFEWHKPEIVAQQLDSSVVKVGSDGKVEGLARELKRIANDESLKFLLAKDNTKQNQQQNGNQQQQNNGGQQTGLQPGQGGANQGGSMPPNATELAELMPALRGRI